MRPVTPFSFPGIEQDVRRLSSLLALGLRTASWNPPARPAILNLACGRADETGVLLEQLNPNSGPVFYLGIDLRGPEIDEARRRWPADPHRAIDFRTGDASRTDRMRQLPAFDLVFIRHQNFWHDVPVWSRLYRNALDALKPSGLLAITSYFDVEHELASACLRHFGAEATADLPHPASRPLPDAPGKSVDRRLALFRPGASGLHAP